MSENDVSAASKKKITLKTSDGQLFDVDEDVAMECETIKNYFEDDVSCGAVVPLPNVTSDALVRVLQYCKKHIEFRLKSTPEAEIKAFDKEFVNEDNITIVNLIHAANYMNIKDLLDLLCQYVADTIKDKSVEEVREFFGIENDFSPEEEREVREQNKWAFD